MHTACDRQLVRGTYAPHPPDLPVGHPLPQGARAGNTFPLLSRGAATCLFLQRRISLRLKPGVETPGMITRIYPKAPEGRHGVGSLLNTPSPCPLPVGRGKNAHSPRACARRAVQKSNQTSPGGATCLFLQRRISLRLKPWAETHGTCCFTEDNRIVFFVICTFQFDVCQICNERTCAARTDRK